MNINFIKGLLPVFVLFTSKVFADGADVSLPQQRESAVQSAVKLWSERGNSVNVPDPAPNPFQFLVEVEVDHSEGPVVAALPSLTGAELLVQLASRIPSSGTVSIGGESILLLGQKRLKVGDSVTISFEGRSYDLLLKMIGSTTFTVSLGSFTHTRATYISSSSRP